MNIGLWMFIRGGTTMATGPGDGRLGAESLLEAWA